MTKISGIKSSTIENAKKEIVKTDERGRKLTIEKPPYLKRLKLIKALGDLAENRAYMNQISFITWLKAIDDAPVQMPGSELELDALINRLDNEGMDTLAAGALEILGVKLDEDVDLEEQEIQSAKK